MIIGISGLAGSGKDTVAAIIQSILNCEVIAYADEIKRIAASLYGFTKEQLWGSSELRKTTSRRYPDLTVREALQKIGTEVGRQVHKDTWVNKLFDDYDKLDIEYNKNLAYYAPFGVGDVNHIKMITGIGVPIRTPGNLVIPDVRWPSGNEGKAIRDRGGVIVRVNRNNAGLTDEQSMHESEMNQKSAPDDIFDFVIDNNSSLDDLYDTVISYILVEGKQYE